MSQILIFLQGNATDNRNRSLNEILLSDDRFLEDEHDYIQWLFPLKEPSANVQGAPIITDDEIATAQSDIVIRKNMQKSLARMTKFYKDNDHWLCPRDHNHLRITRILKSTRMIAGDKAAEQFYDFIMDTVYDAGVEILPSHIIYWTDAVGLSFDTINKTITGYR